MRMFETEFDALAHDHADLYPSRATSPRSTRSTNASTDASTTASIRPASQPRRPPTNTPHGELFKTLDDLDARLAERRYLFGPTPLETDWRLFVTLVRFDAVYVGHFKCNLRRIVDYPNLFGYLRDLYQSPASPRPSTSTTSSGTITTPTTTSTRPASSRSGRRRTSWPLIIGKISGSCPGSALEWGHE